MPGVPIHYVDLRAFAYATEDVRNVEDALRTLVPEETEFDREETAGHHGDRIVVLSTRLERADDVRFVLERVSESADFQRLLSELDDRVTEHTELFFRLDKQAAFDGRVELGDGITFRAKLEAYPAKREKALENARATLERYVDDGSD